MNDHKRILIIDAEPDVHTVLSFSLDGYDCVSAYDASSVQEAFETHLPEMVILGYSWRTEETAQFLKTLQAHAASLGKVTPILVLGAYCDHDPDLRVPSCDFSKIQIRSYESDQLARSVQECFQSCHS